MTYVDGDLGPYHEFAVSFLVRERRRLGAFIHRLPVDGSFTLDAGRSIWGFPKELADFELSDRRCLVRQDGRLVIDVSMRPGVPVSSFSAKTSFVAYSHLDGVTRRTPWTMPPSRLRSRPGGAVVQLGDHPIAAELRELGLPKRAVMTSSIGRLRMTFGDAQGL